MRAPRFVLTVAVALAVVAAPLAVPAQAPRVYRIGIVSLGGPYNDAVGGLRDGLKELGLEEGKHVTFHVHDGKGDMKLVETAARGLEAEKIDLIYTLATSVTQAVKRATQTVPVVFYVGTDPVAFKIVDDFRKPGGRLTGIYGRFTDLTAKRLELLKETAPKVRRVTVFYNPSLAAPRESVRIARDAAKRLGLTLIERRVNSVEELHAALRALKPGETDALFYVSDAMVASQADAVIETARAKRLPTMFHEHGSVAKGALVSYGVSYATIGRLSAKQVHRVLLGTKPADLPVEHLDRLHFVINLKTAKAIGHTVPRGVLVRADEIIE